MNPGTTLVDAARNWPTADSISGNGGPRSRSEKELRAIRDGIQVGKHHRQVNLSDAAALFPTPAARDYRTPNLQPLSKRGGGRKGEQLPNFIAHCFLRDLMSSSDGPKSSDTIARLNPLFVEWLMGLPHGWTDSEPLETALFHSWQRTHSAHLHALLERDFYAQAHDKAAA